MLSSIQEQRQKSVIQELQNQEKKRVPVKDYFTVRVPVRVPVKTITIAKPIFLKVPTGK